MYKLGSVFVDVVAYINNLAKDISTTFTEGNSHQITVLIVFYLVLAIAILLLLRGLVKVIKLLFREIFPSKSKKKPVPVAATAQVPPETTIATETSKEEKSISRLKTFAGKGYSKIISEAFDNCNKTDHGVHDYAHMAETIPPLSIIDDSHGATPDKEVLLKQIENMNLNELGVFLSVATKEKISIDDKVIALKKLVSEASSIREKIAEKELAAIDKYNSDVDELATAKANFESRKADLSISFTELYNRINHIENKITALWNDLADLDNSVSVVPEDVESFHKMCDEIETTLVVELQNKEKVLASSKNDYSVAHKTRVQKDEEIAVQQQQLEEALKNKINQDALLVIISERSKELTEIDNERKAQEEIERQAKEEAERKAKEEAQRLAKEEEQRALERLEQERLEQERRQKDILAQQQNASSTETAPPIADTDITEIKSQLEEHSRNAYSLNFDGISPEMLKKMARAKQKQNLNGKENATGDASDVADESANSTDNNGNNEGADSEEEPRDYTSEIKQQWAAEREHLEKWNAEKARRKEEEQRRKEELLKQFSENKSSDTN